MNLSPPSPTLAREKLINASALLVLLAIGGLALFGPSGLLAWSENSAQLDRNNEQLAELQAQRDVLRNRVELLDPSNVDPDLASELIRRDLNVAHQDEFLIDLEMPQ